MRMPFARRQSRCLPTVAQRWCLSLIVTLFFFGNGGKGEQSVSVDCPGRSDDFEAKDNRTGFTLIPFTTHCFSSIPFAPNPTSVRAPPLRKTVVLLSHDRFGLSEIRRPSDCNLQISRFVTLGVCPKRTKAKPQKHKWTGEKHVHTLTQKV